MCNLYSITTNQKAIRDLVKAIRDITGNLPRPTGALKAVAAGEKQDG